MYNSSAITNNSYWISLQIAIQIMTIFWILKFCKKCLSRLGWLNWCSLWSPCDFSADKLHLEFLWFPTDRLAFRELIKNISSQIRVTRLELRLGLQIKIAHLAVCITRLIDESPKFSSDFKRDFKQVFHCKSFLHVLWKAKLRFEIQSWVSNLCLNVSSRQSSSSGSPSQQIQLESETS